MVGSQEVSNERKLKETSKQDQSPKKINFVTPVSIEFAENLILKTCHAKEKDENKKQDVRLARRRPLKTREDFSTFREYTNYMQMTVLEPDSSKDS